MMKRKLSILINMITILIVTTMMSISAHAAENPVAPDAPTVNSKDIGVTVRWNGVENATGYDVYLATSPYGWEDIKYSASVGANVRSCTFGNIEAGTYGAFVISRPNPDSVQSGVTIIVHRGRCPLITFSYISNLGSGSMPATHPLWNSKYTLPKNSFTRTGYTFKGWTVRRDNDKFWRVDIRSGTSMFRSEHSGFSKTVFPDGYTFNNGDMSLTIQAGCEAGSYSLTCFAVWEPVELTFNFDSNGGSGTMSSINATFDSSCTLPESTFTNEGFTFKGWNLRRDSDNKWWVPSVGWKSAAEADQLGKEKYNDSHYFSEIDASFLTGQESARQFTWFAVWEKDIKNVEKVSLNRSSAEMLTSTSDLLPGQQDARVKLDAAVSPSNAANKKVKWSSSNTSIAKVDASGYVTGLKPGTATITVTTVDGGKTASSKVKVHSRKEFKLQEGAKYTFQSRLNTALSMDVMYQNYATNTNVSLFKTTAKRNAQIFTAEKRSVNGKTCWVLVRKNSTVGKRAVTELKGKNHVFSTAKDTNWQLFRVYKFNDGSIQFINRGSNNAIAIQGGVAANRANIAPEKASLSNSQRWEYVKVG